MEVSVIVTILNEENSLEQLVEAVFAQTFPIKQLIIVDGGSTDQSLSILKKLSKKYSSLQVYSKKGNRSVGRNLAAAKSTTDWLAITDAGCVPNPDWLEQLVKKAKSSGCEVIAGYYAAVAQTNLQKAIVPYALVMPDKVNQQNFLPATRSMLIKKKLFMNLGGFDPALSDNEDYALAIKMKGEGVKIGFALKAVVLWTPPDNLRSFSRMIFRFARGDAQARIFRPKVGLIFARYLFLLGLIGWLMIYQDYGVATFYLILAGIIYSGWSISKNYRYVDSAWLWLPFLQVISDLAVMVGTIAGLFR